MRPYSSQSTSPVILTAALLAASIASASTPVALSAPSTLLVGERPHVRVSGLHPFEQATVETYRVAEVYVKTNGEWGPKSFAFHATARFWAGQDGAIDLDHAAPIGGSYSGADPRGLLWSGAVVGRAPEPAVPADVLGAGPLEPNKVRIVLRVRGRILTVREMAIQQWQPSVRFAIVDTPHLVGVFAAPHRARRAPTIILLHGSEGGAFASAKAEAGLWASHGYAAFALIYFAWPANKVPNAPPAFTNLPVERIAYARDWLRARPEADIAHLGVAGGSKGAEYALIAAATYPWIKAVTACVPSSIVWGGFGAPSGDHPLSFTLGGTAVPSVAYGDYAPVLSGAITSAERHRRDRTDADPAAVARAAIAVERSHAKLLLISGGRDAIWPSDAMAAEVAQRMSLAHQSARVTWRSNPDAGHFLCGTGDKPIRESEADEVGMGGGLVSANGRDPGAMWEATLAFMDAALAPAARSRP